jgi:molybdopterin-guanine dinucleotide biosynthesis protein A
MKRDKATTMFDGVSLVERVYRVARKVFDSIVIVSGHHDSFEGIDAPIIGDVLPASGSMVGIVSALLQTDRSYVFALACDMPFVTEESIRAITEAVRGEDIVIPRTAGGYEPLHAMYRRTCISYMLSSIGRGWPKLSDIFPYLSVRVVERHPSFLAGGISGFTNVNTLEELVLVEQQTLCKTVPTQGEEE